MPQQFKKLFKKPKESFVAVNLGNFCLKGLIVKAGEPEGYFIEKNEGLSSERIKKLWAKEKILERKVRISIKNPTCLVRYFSFPKTDKKKLKQALFYELNKFIPFSPDEVYFDFCILKELGPSENLILLAVVKKRHIDEVLAAFRKANLKVSEVNLDSICLINLFLNNSHESKNINSCILDIGHNFSTMTILNKGIPFLTRDVKFSAKDIFQIISRVKNYSEAGIEKRLLSLEDSSQFLELIQDSISNICEEMKSSFDYFEVNKGERIDKLYLSGGLVSVKNIAHSFSDFLDMEVEILDVFSREKQNLDKSFFSKEFMPFKNSFSAAFGLIL